MNAMPWACEPVRPIDGITAPTFLIPDNMCDTHMHVFGPISQYPPVTDARYDWPGGTLNQYLGIADRLSIARMVFVQPSYYGLDNSCMFDLMQKVTQPYRAVVFMPDALDAGELDAMHEIGVRGLRLDFFKAVDDGMDQQDMEDMLVRAARAAQPLGWHVELYSPGYITYRLFGAISRAPVPVSINHFGYMSQIEGIEDRHFQEFVAFVGTSNCWVKLTAPYRMKPVSPERTIDMARQLVDIAPDRILWGTDWPHIPQGSIDTGTLFNNLLAWCPDESRRNAILVDNPARLYQFD